PEHAAAEGADPLEDAVAVEQPVVGDRHARGVAVPQLAVDPHLHAADLPSSVAAMRAAAATRRRATRSVCAAGSRTLGAASATTPASRPSTPGATPIRIGAATTARPGI